MKRRTLISLLCAGVLTVGAFTGLTGFAQKDDEAAAKTDSTFTLLSTAEDETETEEEIKADGTITGVSDVAAKVMPAVVSITNKSVTEVEDIFSMYGMYGYGYGRGGNGNGGQTRTYESESVGSGIIIGQSDTELLICTNYHVVEDATEITVGFVDDNICEAVLKGSDESNDLAVVAVSLDNISEDTLDQISIAEIGDSDKLLVGEQVVAIGNALGYGQSVTTGIVSALNRTIDLDGYNASLIQTDAAINPGNSGGALLDMKGRVIGINSAKAAASGVEGMGYAIPISYAKPILEDLMNKVTRTETVSDDEKGFIGITGQGVTDEFSSLYGVPQGIYVTDVTDGSPADEAGLSKGDVITKFDGSSVTDMETLRSMLAYYAAGETVTMTVESAENGEYTERQVELTLGLAADYQ
jgi:serine protease Do